jgi:site-specific DNA recombinase
VNPIPKRCAIYTRKSSEEGLDMSFNSLDAQRAACEAYVLSQLHEGWTTIPIMYDDGGFSGGNMERPGLKRLLAAISAGQVDTVVVYKVDRLTRSLADFAKIVETFDSKGITFVSVTQQFNTTSSMGRLTLNVLLSFAQFEREVTGERIRDKVAASKKKGIWMGGKVPLGYDLGHRELIVNPEEAVQVREIFRQYLRLGSVLTLAEHLRVSGIRSKQWTSRKGATSGGAVFSRGSLYYLLASPIYIGKIIHKEKVHDGLHEAIIDQKTWDATRVMMKSHEPNRNGPPSSDSQRFLRGLLYLPDGRRLGPTHATKGSRRYSYYFAAKDVASHADAVRLPALELERRVVEAVRGLLENPLQLSAHFSELPVRDTQRLLASVQKMALKLAGVATSASRLMLRSMLVRVTIQHSELSIEIDCSSLVTEAPGTQASTQPITLTVPYEIARRGRQVRLVITGSASSEQAPIPSLIRAVAMARDWAARIAEGEIFELNELAREYGIERSYAQKVFRCVALSPRHIEAILGGQHEAGLTFAAATANVPLQWQLQGLGVSG